ncbi:MAG: dihydrolipoyl dehydrogenase [Candidatus Nanohaloarchaea archaeon]|nr:dihydrolipoyl dehydrogenase [Candidatus Nanohaloarchaea archaeon]
MEEYDAIVLGAGSGLDVASALANRDWQVAVVEPGPLGGTCLNRGCIPSKMLIHHADVAETIRGADEFHIDAEFNDADFSTIVDEVNETVGEDAEAIERGVRKSDNHTLYKTEAEFVDEKTLEVDDERISSDMIVVAAGSRPMIPPIDGLDEVDYLTSKEALSLDEQPDELVIIGGGYIAVELAHFYAALGTEVTIIEMADSLVSREDEDIAATFTELAQERDRWDVNLGLKASQVEQDGDRITVHAEDEDGNEHSFAGDELLVAAGRVPNTDKLKVEEAGLETDDRGFLEVDDHMRTSQDGVYALGDIAGEWMFKHSANHEAQTVLRNILGMDDAVDYTAMPHAIFSAPQVAGVGRTEQELEEQGVDYAVGTYDYGKTGMGLALKEDDGFVKVLVDNDSGEILGCHIIGPEASTLIHEVLVAMKAGSGTVDDIRDTIHIHPALNEVVQRAFNSV